MNGGGDAGDFFEGSGSRDGEGEVTGFSPGRTQRGKRGMKKES